MRNLLLKVSLLAFAVSPLAARATTIDQQIVITGGADTYTFIVPTTVVPTVYDLTPNTFSPPNTFADFTISGVEVITTPGGTDLNDTVEFDAAIVGGGLFDMTQPNITFNSSTAFFTGNASGITFTNGASGTLNDGITSTVYNYTVSNYTPPAAPAPEPSSLILLGTGALGLVGSLRRKLFA